MKLKISDLSAGDLPRERAIKLGMAALGNHEVLAIILRTGYNNQNVLQLAYEILATSEGLSGLSKLSYEELRKIKGLKEAKALSLMAAFEISKRLEESRSESLSITTPNAIYSLFSAKLKNENQERFYVVFLNIKNKLTSYKEMFVGGLDRSLVHARDIFREAVKNNAARIILVHNHPSGDPTPSAADTEVTKKIIAAGEVLGISVIDHIIIGNGSFVSLKAINAI